MTRKMRLGSCNQPPEMGLFDNLESIELQLDQHNRLSLPNPNHFHESDSTQRLLLPKDVTPSDSKSSSGCKYLKDYLGTKVLDY